VTFDDAVSAIDVLTIINYINAHPGVAPPPDAPAAPPPFYDVHIDGAVTAQDVLQVINEINKQAAKAGEGEAFEFAFVARMAQEMWPASRSSIFSWPVRTWQERHPQPSTTRMRPAGREVPMRVGSPDAPRAWPPEYCGEQRSAGGSGDPYDDLTWLDSFSADILGDIESVWRDL